MSDVQPGGRVQFPPHRRSSYGQRVGWIAGLCALATPGAAPAAPVPSRQPLPVRDFRRQVLPVLTRLGCNSGACHGAAIGRGGFRLSLLGYDPQGDYDTVVHEQEGRRVDLIEPTASILLRKPLGAVPHGGGKRLDPGTPYYRTLRDWLAGGAPFGDSDRRVVGLEVLPADALFPAPGARVPLRVRARWSDGESEDVTALALFTSHDPALAPVSEAGEVLLRGRGVSVVMVRYQGQAVAARLAVPLSDRPAHSQTTPTHPVDRAVQAELSRLRIPASPPASPVEFRRRLTLDLLGVLPTEAEARAAGSDTRAAGSRTPVVGTKPATAHSGNGATAAALVDELLQRPEFTDYWTFRLADLLLISSKRLGREGASAYHHWLRDQIAGNRPLGAVVRDLLLAEGNTSRIGPANFYRTAADPRETGEFVGRTLLGIRIQCARCHQHPFDRWSQDDYHAFAALFSRIRLEGGAVRVTSRGEIPHPKTGEDVPPRVLPVQANPGTRTAPADRRLLLADWLAPHPAPAIGPTLTAERTEGRRGGGGANAQPVIGPAPIPSAQRPAGGVLSNLVVPPLRPSASSAVQQSVPRRSEVRNPVPQVSPLLARALANRIWKLLLGRGVVEPVDDLRPTNPPTNPALLRVLEQEFQRTGGDLRALIRLVVTSQTYGRSSRSLGVNRNSDREFARALVRPLDGQILADVLAQATGVPDRSTADPQAQRTVQWIASDEPSYTLDVFGRCGREGPCEPGARGGGLAQALHLMHGQPLEQKLRVGIAVTLVGASNAVVIERLYLRTLSRFPTSAERTHWESTLESAADRPEAIQDLLWSLVNCREFAFNH